MADSRSEVENVQKVIPKRELSKTTGVMSKGLRSQHDEALKPKD